MKYFSTFTGIGGFELGIGEEHECVGYSEIDKYAVQIYQKHFPNHKNYGDITKINEHTLPDFDLFCGGFPCQAFSIAGLRKGFEDTRGTLFFDIARILRAKQPRLLLLENVKGLLSHDNGGTFKTIVATLTELGYDLQWQVLNSKNHGVAQNRERVLIVGHLRGTPRPEVFPLRNNGAVPSKTNESEKSQPQTKLFSTIRTKQGSRADDNYIKVIGSLEGGGWEKRHEQIRRVHSTEGLSPTIPTGTGGGVMTKIGIIQKSQDWREDGSLRTFEKISPTIRANMGDNHPMVVAERGRYDAQGKIKQTLEPRKDNLTNTLTSVEKDNRVYDGMSIRRLTPVECERLQGFPDNWTEGISDTQRYKCLGNAVTTNVIRDVVIRMIKQDMSQGDGTEAK